MLFQQCQHYLLIVYHFNMQCWNLEMYLRDFLGNRNVEVGMKCNQHITNKQSLSLVQACDVKIVFIYF